MASKKKTKKKASPAQLAARAKFAAMAKARAKAAKGGKKAPKKAAAVAAPATAAPKKRRKKATTKKATHAAPKKSAPKRHRKKASKKSSSAMVVPTGRKGVVSTNRVLTAQDVIKTARAQHLHAYVCAGPRRSGCGGGSSGSHVVGILA